MRKLLSVLALCSMMVPVAAFAQDAAGVTAAGKTSRGRPDTAAGDFRWAYTIGAPRSVALPTRGAP